MKWLTGALKGVSLLIIKFKSLIYYAVGFFTGKRVARLEIENDLLKRQAKKRVVLLEDLREIKKRKDRRVASYDSLKRKLRKKNKAPGKSDKTPIN